MHRSGRSPLGYIPIHDPDDPRLAPYRSLKGKELERSGLFISEGEKVVTSMAASGCRPASCLVADNTLTRHKPLLAALRKKGAAIYVAPASFIGEVIGFRFHRGIMAAGYCPEKRAAADALKGAGPGQLLVALNAVNDPQNVGLIARSAAAFGVRALLVDSATYDPYYRKAVRVSMGAIFRLPVFHESDLASSLRWLKKEFGVRIIATSPGKGSVDIDGADLSGPACLILGNEDAGVSRDLLRIADVKVRIPIAKDIDSLNVAGAAAIVLYEATRKRSPK